MMLEQDVRITKQERWLSLAFVRLGVLAGCNRMIIPRQTQLSKDADAKAAESSYADAINLTKRRSTAVRVRPKSTISLR